MKRVKKHRIKREMPESSQIRDEEHDLAYYIHDRVELMHQVFSVLKHKELRAMAPECVRNISLDDLQELCTEELLGISSKRLCAILDGADPPSNTDSSSSSPERLETISLDSISSDEEILSQSSSKRNKKHKHHRHTKSKHKKRKDTQKPEEDENNKASRAGLTVLELLELQARARAIRAQLQQHQAVVPAEQTESLVPSSGDDEVMIKEEAPEVVEISSEDEKPSVQELEKKIENTKPKETLIEENANTVTKRINDLIITVPQTKTTRKIKLNRTKSVKKDNQVYNVKTVQQQEVPKITVIKDTQKDKKKKKQKKKEKQKDGSDHDEITLQLSDSEKMDLLEDYDRNRVSSEDSESSSDSNESSSSSSDGVSKKTNSVNGSDTISVNLERKSNYVNQDEIKVAKKVSTSEKSPEKIAGNIEEKVILITSVQTCSETQKENSNSIEVDESKNSEDKIKTNTVLVTVSNDKNLDKTSNEIETEEIIKTIQNETVESGTVLSENKESSNYNKVETFNCEVKNSDQKYTNIDVEDGEIVQKHLSDGELSEDSMQIKESNDEVVCISDEENRTKKKKEKKSKKSKKLDFRKSADQNFFKISEKSNENRETPIIHLDISKCKSKFDVKQEAVDIVTDCESKIKDVKDNTDHSIDDVFEFFELSDDSSCYEVEGLSILSKEPTTEEIVALSARIDDIKREDIITEDEIREYERFKENKDLEEVENISWKERYLDSKKVKTILSTANILNALRKKNKELKKKIEETEKEVCTEAPVAVLPEEKIVQVIEGSIDQYHTLQGSTKYVDPVKDPETIPEKVSKEMEKDAKQLLKMYKKLLKYNDMNKKRDPSKKKKKKKNKNKEKDNECAIAKFNKT